MVSHEGTCPVLQPCKRSKLRIRRSRKPHLYLLTLEGKSSVVHFRKSTHVTAKSSSGLLPTCPLACGELLLCVCAEKPLADPSSLLVSPPCRVGGARVGGGEVGGRDLEAPHRAGTLSQRGCRSEPPISSCCNTL